MLGASGCDDDDAIPVVAPTATATVTETAAPLSTATHTQVPSATATRVPPTATATEEPTATPTTRTGSGHDDLFVGASQAEGGNLVIDPESATEVPVTFSACIGGTGDECDGGVFLYSGILGLKLVEADRPEESIFKVANGVPLSIEVVARDAGTSLQVEGTVLDEVGENTLVGETQDHFHEHGEFQLTFPGGEEPPTDRRVTVKFTAPEYGDSGDHPVLLEPSENGHGHE